MARDKAAARPISIVTWNVIRLAFSPFGNPSNPADRHLSIWRWMRSEVVLRIGPPPKRVLSATPFEGLMQKHRQVRKAIATAIITQFDAICFSRKFLFQFCAVTGRLTKVIECLCASAGLCSSSEGRPPTDDRDVPWFPPSASQAPPFVFPSLLSL